MKGIVLELIRGAGSGAVVGISAVDPATIFKAKDPTPERTYVQVINGKPVQTFHADDLILVPIGELP